MSYATSGTLAPVDCVMSRPLHVVHDCPNFLLLMEPYFLLISHGILLFDVSQHTLAVRAWGFTAWINLPETSGTMESLLSIMSWHHEFLSPHMAASFWVGQWGSS